MKTTEQFNVICAAFEALLNRHLLWQSYYQNFKRQKLEESNCQVYTTWKTWAINTRPELWLAGAFIWDKSEEGDQTWRAIAQKWENWLKANIKN